MTAIPTSGFDAHMIGREPRNQVPTRVDLTRVPPQSYYAEDRRSDFFTQHVYPTYGSIKILKIDNFFNDRLGVSLSYSDCFLVCFHDNSETSKQILIQMTMASYTPGPIYGAVNIMVEKDLVNRFNAIKQDPDHPYNHFAPLNYPHLLVYRNGFPQFVYEGPIDHASISTFMLGMGCRPGFKNAFCDMSNVQIPTGPLAPYLEPFIPPPPPPPIKEAELPVVPPGSPMLTKVNNSGIKRTADDRKPVLPTELESKKRKPVSDNPYLK